MKLVDHVDKIKNLIQKSFANDFARIGITAAGQDDILKISDPQRPKREKLDRIIENHIAETGSFSGACEKTVDEFTFTLFNRVAAVKVMEAHRMFPEIITRRPDHGNRSFAHKAWLEQHPHMSGEDLEGIGEFIQSAFDNLGEKIPLFHRNYHYAGLPYVIDLNDIIDAFNAIEKDRDIDNDIWQSDDILGWLYESYNNAKKQAFKADRKKTEYDRVAVQSQVYTPRWVVKFLVDNSLGKLYLEMYPDSDIKNRYLIANAPDTRVRPVKPLTDIKIIDPAVGSGNFLFYAFDLFYDLYMDQIDEYGADYDEDDIPKTIIENNLHGIDIDDRAVQIAQLGLYIKALRKNRDVTIDRFNIVSSDFFLPDFDQVAHMFDLGMLDESAAKMIKNSWSYLQDAHKFGSLVKIEDNTDRIIQQTAKLKKRAGKAFFSLDRSIERMENAKKTLINQLSQAVDQKAIKTADSFLGVKTRDALVYLTLLTMKYDVAVANPPYTDSADFGSELKRFVAKNYKEPDRFHVNLYACFINRCVELAEKTGKIAMIHPRTFMFIKSFEGVRKYILNNLHINLFIDYSLSNLFGPIMVDPAFYVLEKGIITNEDSWFVSLDQYTRTPQEKFKKEYTLAALENHITGKSNKNSYSINQSSLKIIKSWPFIYWISDNFRNNFGLQTIGDLFDAAIGLQTSNNERFVRFWWEVRKSDIFRNRSGAQKWVYYDKGGPFNKWFGNKWMVVNWRNKGWEIKNFFDKNGNLRSVIRNEKFYFQKGITYPLSGTKGASFRLFEENMIFDISAPCIFSKTENINFLLGFLNSNLVFYILDCLNPTVHITTGDIRRIPFVKPGFEIQSIFDLLVSRNVKIKKRLYSYSIIETNYYASPFTHSDALSMKDRLIFYLNFTNHLSTQILINEAIINEKIFEIYELTPADKAMVIAKEGESVGNLPVQPEAKAAYLNEDQATREFPLDQIKDFIENLPEKTFTEEEKKQITDGFPRLYQKNNNLEEFCIRNQVNPINVWYWFKQSRVVPKQRMNEIAMEFLADLIREVLMEDEDGIAPLVRNAGEEILIDRIERKFIEKGFSSAQFAQFDKVLGRELNDYLNHQFFKALSDHLNLFMYLPKTPFIWHITSGPSHGFDAYVIIYKWNRDRLFALKSVYVERRETALKNRHSDIRDDASAKAQNEKDLIFRQLKEIENLKTRIDALLAEGYDPVLDDGVGKNIAPLQKKGIIAYDVLNAKQLEKYLNADW